MKKLSTLLLGLLLVFGITFLTSNEAEACNLSQTSLITVTPGPGTDTTVSLQVCFGFGVTGTTNGADGDTRTVSFGWYTSQPGFTVNAFTPASITGTVTGCTMPAANVGPLGAPYNTAGTVLYVDPGYYGYAPCAATPFTCITSTALCGNVGSQCMTFTFQLSFIPDSMRVFGVEGGGNAIAGCYPDSDMSIDFTILAVEWADVAAISKPEGLEISWATFSESNSDFFILERSNGTDEFEAIANINAMGNSTVLSSYKYLDKTPHAGINRYRLVQVAKDGGASYSPIAEGLFGNPERLSLTAVGPVPTQDFVKVAFASPNDGSYDLLVTDITGKSIVTDAIEAHVGGNEFELDMSQFNSGIYFLRLSGAAGKLTYKVIKE